MYTQYYLYIIHPSLFLSSNCIFPYFRKKSKAPLFVEIPTLCLQTLKTNCISMLREL